ncbi:hypothetical protein Q0Z83_038880 [Actinoplanes sichuanensis]|nr:hypothetical protein Q0Z83_038880 [Actinoplanes sichuanensis]
MPWPCIEAYVQECRRREEGRVRTAVSDPAPVGDRTVNQAPLSWDAPTMPLFQVARAGALTPAQEHRAGQ